MTIRFIFISILVLIVYGCKSKNILEIQDDKLDYLIDHFPNDMLDIKNDILIVDSSAYYNTTKMILFRKLTNEQIEQIRSKNYLFICKAKDECIIVINDYLNSNNEYLKLDKQKSKFNSSCDLLIPIPNFYDLPNISLETRSHLKPECDIYITNLNRGVQSSKIDVTKTSMPKGYEHGVVSGIVLSDEDSTGIYFVQYW